jgi:hypothetical protein
MENSLTEIKCLICGLPYRALGCHINSQHGINVVEYVRRFPGAPTTSKELSAKFAEAGTNKQNYVRTEGIRRQTAASVSASLIKGYQEDPTRAVRMGNTLRQTHVDDPSLGVRMSNSQRLSYENDPTRSVRQSETLKQTHQDDPSIRQRMSESQKKADELDPTISMRRSESIKKTYANDPSIGVQLSESSKKSYENDPTRGTRQGESLHQAHIDDPSISVQMSKSLKRKYQEDPTLADRISDSLIRAYQNDPSIGEGISRTLKRLHLDHPELSIHQSVVMKALWADDEFARMMWKAQHKCPNFPEEYLLKVLDKNFSGLWEYTGDGRFRIKGRNPDFKSIDNIHLLEIFGYYFHNPYYFPKRPSEEELIAHYEKYGFKCLIFWQYDVFDEKDVVEKVKEFMLT